MSWRRLEALVAGLSEQSVLRWSIRQAPISDPDQIIAVLEGGLSLE